MNTKIAPTKIGSREFIRNFKKIKQATISGEAFDVLDHGVTVFHVVPPATKKVYKYTFEDLKKIRFSADDKNLAMNIDAYLYGKG